VFRCSSFFIFQEHQPQLLASHTQQSTCLETITTVVTRVNTPLNLPTVKAKTNILLNQTTPAILLNTNNTLLNPAMALLLPLHMANNQHTASSQHMVNSHNTANNLHTAAHNNLPTPQANQHTAKTAEPVFPAVIQMP
jgi:hypothetical protein